MPERNSCGNTDSDNYIRIESHKFTDKAQRLQQGFVIREMGFRAVAKQQFEPLMSPSGH